MVARKSCGCCGGAAPNGPSSSVLSEAGTLPLPELAVPAECVFPMLSAAGACGRQATAGVRTFWGQVYILQGTEIHGLNSCGCIPEQGAHACPGRPAAAAVWGGRVLRAHAPAWMRDHFFGHWCATMMGTPQGTDTGRREALHVLVTPLSAQRPQIFLMNTCLYHLSKRPGRAPLTACGCTAPRQWVRHGSLDYASKWLCVTEQMV